MLLTIPLVAWYWPSVAELGRRRDLFLVKTCG